MEDPEVEGVCSMMTDYIRASLLKSDTLHSVSLSCVPHFYRLHRLGGVFIRPWQSLITVW